MLNDFLDNFERAEAEENIILCEHAENYERDLEEENRLLCENADNFEREHLKRPAEILVEDIQEGGIIDYFDIEIVPERVNRNFEVRELAFRLKFKNLPSEIGLLEDILRNAISSILSHVRNIYPNDFVKFLMMHENLDNPKILWEYKENHHKQSNSM